MRSLSGMAMVVVLGSHLTGCGGAGLYDPGLGGEHARAVVDGNNAFAFDLYDQLRKADGNLIFSPFSVSTALAMPYAGARGETERQMRTVLHFPETQSELHAVIKSTVDDVLRRAANARVELSIANLVWVDRDLALLGEFLDVLHGSYGADPGRIDFADVEGARKAINDWVETKTRGRIADVVPPGDLGQLPSMVLANAIYFKADWQTPFNPRWTRDAPFYTSPEAHTQARMMGQTAQFGYMEDSTCQILSMPYRGDDFTMVVVLPRERNGLADLEVRMDAASIGSRLQSLVRQKVIVQFPRFKLAGSVRLVDALKRMGMSDAFHNGNADFSGMTGEPLLFLTRVLHMAHIDVAEEGTEAAAATVIVVAPSCMPGRPKKAPPVFRADHPFLFMVRDARSGSIVLMGRVVDPTK